ncbi:Daunorubicin/doxorubicin resistance ATP-binding protein DrrA [Caprobacter fermentans]|uniref:Daunorubicin/doxorubicin resistance ATP-binding protein DrrA n=1 Tax=Caproicibacter fermentans TaxID=2576756 RepID=A0A6N8I086_9FIRM|nr:ABC transporter ATP-binding protein [Caproicibacter fermentans]MVB11554.1 Daunorubicin/doxorubicin resistance ATP-binding protein DrrA [Caproicibacter fermentans]OCN02748.1 ABC transporter ATP-binding protein [Clostridium sp. W14A]
MSEIAIHTQKLGKSYDGAVYALHDLSLEIPTGAVFGFLGPNGAGKTTTIKLLSGLLKPTEGSCTVLGIQPEKKPSELHRVCGIVTETARMYGRLTGMENMMFFGQAQGLERRESRQRAEILLKSLDLWDSRDKKLADDSTGMVQRLSLARAMIAKPKLLLLDEPTNGLDRESVLHVNSMILDLARREGVTVFLCTHQLRDAQELCDSFGIVSRGKMLACGDLESLSREVGLSLQVRFRLREGKIPDELQRLDDESWGRDIADEEEMPKLISGLVSSGNEIFEAKLVRPSLEDIYSRFVELRGNGK